MEADEGERAGSLMGSEEGESRRERMAGSDEVRSGSLGVSVAC